MFNFSDIFIRHRTVLLLALCIFSYSTPSQSQKKTSSPLSISANVNYGRIQIHSKKIKYLRGTHPYGAEININRHYFDDETRELCNCFPRIGLSLSYWNFNHPTLGHSYTALGYIEPFLSFSKSILVSIKAATGLGWFSNPYNVKSNPGNLSYSTSLNFPLQLSLTTYFRLRPQLNLFLSGNYSHWSNGGVKQPNLGINMASLSLGLDYNLQQMTPSTRQKKLPLKSYQQNKWIQGGVVFATRESESKNQNLINSLISTIHQRFTRQNALHTGVLIEQELQNISFNDHIYRASLLAGHDLIMGKINFSQTIGWHTYSSSESKHPLFQIYGLNYTLSETPIKVGFILKAFLENAEYLGISMLYTL